MFSNKKLGLKKNYVSNIDQLLQVLNNLPGVRSNSRLAEEYEYQRIFALRDIPQVLQIGRAHV